MKQNNMSNEALNGNFAKPLLWDSFKNLLGWAFKQQLKWIGKKKISKAVT
jgi:hypothetical protein